MKVYDSILGQALFSMILTLCFSGCGSPMYPQPQAPVEDMSKYLPVVTEVSGSAAFGAHCNYGTYQDPVAVPLELYNCPMGLEVLELEKQLPALMFQIDCRKRTLDIRGPTLGTKMTTWEFLPDGHFWLALDGGYAQLKEDGAGNTGCVTPLVAELWGDIDCTDMDKAKMHIETVWWMDKNYNTLIGTSAPGGPATEPSATPSPNSPTSDPVPSTPTPTPPAAPEPAPTSPMPAPSIAVPNYPSAPANPNPNNRPWLYLRGMKLPHASSTGASVDSPFPGATATPASTIPRDLPRCKMPAASTLNTPAGCYLHTVNHFNMCL